MSNTKRIQALVDSALEVGHMSESDHEWILREIQKDGTIDPAESAILSTIFQATKSGTLRVGEAGEQSRSADLAARKREALERDRQHTERRASPQSHSSLNEEAPASKDTVAAQFQPQTSANAARPEPSAAQQSPSFEELFESACQPRAEGPDFKLQNDRLLDVKLEGKLWIKTGSMVGYYGNITFTREGISEHGLKKLVKKALTGEGSSLTKAVGSGNLYLADQGKKVSVIDLRGQSLTVNGPSILAFQDCVDWDITFLKQVAAMMSGGFFQVRLCGMGVVAITTHFDPIVLRVSPANPVMTDYHATVAWSSGVTPSLKTDISMQTMIGRSSGETLQLAFHGDGFVVIQPYEEIPLASE